MEKKRFTQNEIIFREGSFGEDMYQIITGKVDIIVGFETDKERKLAVLSEGDIFGEMAMLGSWSRSATVIAAENTEVAVITPEEVNDFFKNEPEKVKTIMTNLSRRTRKLSEDYVAVCDTIREMNDTEEEKRPEDLLERISKFIGQYKNIFAGREKDFQKNNPSYELALFGTASVVETRQYAKNEVIFREGDDGTCMYRIRTGKVGIYANFEKSNEKLLTELKENEFFGEMGLIEKMPRSATAVSMEDGTEIQTIAEDELDKLMKESPAIVLMAMQHMSDRLRVLTDQYRKACYTLTSMAKAEKEDFEMTADDIYLRNYFMNIAMARTPGYF